MTLADRLDHTGLRRLAGPRTYERGWEYARDARVVDIAPIEDGVSGIVRGTRPYRATLTAAHDDVGWSCDCPVGEDGEPCKHVVALGIAWLEAQDPGPSPIRGPGDDHPSNGGPRPVTTMSEAAAWLHSLDASELVTLVIAETDQDDGLRARLIARATLALHDDGPSQTLRRAIDQATSVPLYGYRRREAWGLADGIGAVVDRIESFLAPGTADAVVDLAEAALRSVETLLGEVDDSDGDLGILRGRLMALHLAACRLAAPDPVGLADRLYTWEVGSDWETFHRAARTYADVLGPAGLAEYRRLAEADWATVPTLGPGEREERTVSSGGRHRPTRFAVTAIMLTLEELAGDVDAQIAVLTRDLSSAYRFLAIAEVCQAAGRGDAAIDWAERGIRAFPARTDSRLRRFLADRYLELGRFDEALTLTWADFTEHPGQGTYRQLRADAEAAGDRSEWQVRAMAYARSLIREPAGERLSAVLPREDAPWNDWSPSDGSVVVELSMVEGDLDEAWRAAWNHGCRRRLWLELADARQGSHPGDAAMVHQREAEELIASKQRGGYEQAVAQIVTAARLLVAAGRGDDVGPYLDHVQARHKRKTSLMALLDAARIAR